MGEVCYAQAIHLGVTHSIWSTVLYRRVSQIPLPSPASSMDLNQRPHLVLYDFVVIGFVNDFVVVADHILLFTRFSFS